jgi:hypothetical protein
VILLLPRHWRKVHGLPGTFEQASFQFLLLLRSKVFMFPEIFYLKH